MKRYKEQESGVVLRWFEQKNLVASVVKGDHTNERELRVSNNKGSISARGMFKDLSDKKLKEQIRRLAKDIR
jgi:hypothetical protein